MKTIIKIMLMLAVLAYLAVAVTLFYRPVEDIICHKMEIEVLDTTTAQFVDEDYVRDVLVAAKIAPEGQKLSRVNLLEIEKVLRENPYLMSANCYYTDKGVLCIDVTPRKPILLVMASNGQRYYLDEKGSTMPANRFCLPLCVATGNITKEYAATGLLPLARVLYADEFWNRQVEQIYVEDANNVILYPRMGNHKIVLGNTDQVGDKLARMLLFYKKGLPQAGWNRYESINLAYEGQIVCKKRKDKK